MYGTIGTQERLLVRQGKQAIRVRAIGVLNGSHKRPFFMDKRGKLSLHYPCYPFLSEVLIILVLCLRVTDIYRHVTQ